MPRVVCKSRNASQFINGWRFAPLDDDQGGGMLSEELPEAVAAGFLSIKGYTPFQMPPGSSPYGPRGVSERKASTGRASAAASHKEARTDEC